MSAKFFNNTPPDTLFNKFKGIADGMSNFDAFCAVVGYFRSSGYFKLRKELDNVKHIKILVGINIDNIFRKHNQAMVFFGGDDEQIKQIYTKDFIQDVRDAKYSQEVEEGILQLCDDIASGKLEMRIHKSKNLHAKFYLCLPENFSPNTDGWVIMGSSNISDAGLGFTRSPRYELNVAMKDYDDVAYCKSEFDTLWKEGVPINKGDITTSPTHLWQLPKPYEIFMKVLIDAFGSQVEDNFSLQMPRGYMSLKYQQDAAIQGFQMLKEHDGFFLADVVGTGKTVVAAMIAKRFVEENGRHTHILVVCPPAVEENWRDTFGDFGLSRRYTTFLTYGSLNHVLEGRDNCLGAEEFDLVIVDEAHIFRNNTSGRYDELQRICRTPRIGDGRIPGAKKVMLLSATPLNNRPEDFRNLILLFQKVNHPKLSGVTNINTLFQPWTTEYSRLMGQRGAMNDRAQITQETDRIYEEMRTQVLQQILVRRTRRNLLNNPEYRTDLDAQGVHFPQVEQPKEIEYHMNEELSQLFYDTMTILTDMPNPKDNPQGKGLHYARHRAIEFITGPRAQDYGRAVQSVQTLSGIFRTFMVKRLESSFYAFKQSLKTFERITNDMITMWSNNNILIAPNIDVQGMLTKDMEWEEIVKNALAHGHTEDEIVFTQADFLPEYIELLREDAAKLKQLSEQWEAITVDPKFDTFRNLLQNELLQPTITNEEGEQVELNKEGKLVVFSESVDTINYLGEQLKALGHDDVLMVSAANRRQVLHDIKANFDANFEGKKENKYNIILTSDVLAEGVNLHRSNVIVNYDSPWNATRLMQRIGRVNRIGSTSDHIYNYMFYPSKDGEQQIQLYTNALIKLQGFHAALGEDAQVYSHEEVVHEFQLFDTNVTDNVDAQLKLLREVRELYATDRALYDKIKALPCKSRTVRKAEYRPKALDSQSTLAYIRTGKCQQFYRITANQTPIAIPFVDAAELFRAEKDEQPIDNWGSVKTIHYEHVSRIYKQYISNLQKTTETADTTIEARQRDRNTTEALTFLREMKRIFHEDALYPSLLVLEQYVSDGVFTNLTLKINKLKRTVNRNRQQLTPTEQRAMLAQSLSDLYDRYNMGNREQTEEDNTLLTEIITSETFE